MTGLENVQVFSGLLAEEMQSVEQTAEMRAYSPSQVIFREGESGDGLYIVMSGEVEISAIMSGEQRRVLRTVKPGDFFGEMAVLDNEVRSATATSIGETKALFIGRDDLLSILERSPQLAYSLMREFSQRMRDSNRKYIDELLQAERLTLVGRFARSIVHDFKNPLNIIGLAAEMGCMEGAGESMRSSAYQRITKQVGRLSNMINELLEFTRGSQSEIVLAKGNYASFLRPLLTDIREEIETKSVTLELENGLPEVDVFMDQGRLIHVFYNLIHNSVDEMPSGGRIMLRFREEEGRLVTEIEDTGKGIAPEIASKLFEPFATHGKSQGTGLGLSICKKIIEDHRGELKALASKPGKGAIFCFTLRTR